MSTSAHQAVTLEPRQLFIDNEFRPAKAGGMFETVDPSTETVLTQVARGKAEDVDAAVRAADDARRGPWSDLTPAARGQLLFKLADATTNARGMAMFGTTLYVPTIDNHMLAFNAHTGDLLWDHTIEGSDGVVRESARLVEVMPPVKVRVPTPVST